LLQDFFSYFTLIRSCFCPVNHLFFFFFYTETCCHLICKHCSSFLIGLTGFTTHPMLNPFRFTRMHGNITNTNVLIYIRRLLLLTVNHTNTTHYLCYHFIYEHVFSDVQINTDITASNLWFITPLEFYTIWLNLAKSLYTVPDLFLDNWDIETL